MKVKELIEDLKHLPPDAEVYAHNPTWRLTPYITVWNTYEGNRRVVQIVGDCNEEIEEKMDAKQSKSSTIRREYDV